MWLDNWHFEDVLIPQFCPQGGLLYCKFYICKNIKRSKRCAVALETNQIKRSTIHDYFHVQKLTKTTQCSGFQLNLENSHAIQPKL